MPDAKRSPEAACCPAFPVQRTHAVARPRNRQTARRKTIQPAMTCTPGDGITMCQAVSALADAEHGDAIVTDVGKTNAWGTLLRVLTPRAASSPHGGLGTMGFQGCPQPSDKSSACRAGGGEPSSATEASQMTIQELGTIKQEQLGLTVVVLNNSLSGYGPPVATFHDRRHSFTPDGQPDYR